MDCKFSWQIVRLTQKPKMAGKRQVVLKKNITKRKITIIILCMNNEQDFASCEILYALQII